MTQQPATPSKEMSRKDALAQMYHLYDAWRMALPYEEMDKRRAEREGYLQALWRLTQMLYGPSDPCTQYPSLCDSCYRHYAERFVRVVEHPGAREHLQRYCLPCIERLRSAGQCIEDYYETLHREARRKKQAEEQAVAGEVSSC
jgi:hypothetical protein